MTWEHDIAQTWRQRQSVRFRAKKVSHAPSLAKCFYFYVSGIFQFLLNAPKLTPLQLITERLAANSTRDQPRLPTPSVTVLPWSLRTLTTAAQNLTPVRTQTWAARIITEHQVNNWNELNDEAPLTTIVFAFGQKPALTIWLLSDSAMTGATSCLIRWRGRGLMPDQPVRDWEETWRWWRICKNWTTFCMWWSWKQVGWMSVRLPLISMFFKIFVWIEDVFELPISNVTSWSFQDYLQCYNLETFEWMLRFTLN